MSRHRDRYREYAAGRKDISTFLQPWWLDTWSAQGRWDVCLSAKNNDVDGVLIYDYVKKYGLTTVTNAPMCPYAGPHLASRLTTSRLDQMVTDLANQLPSASYTRLKLAPNFQLSPAWHWQDYRYEGLLTLTIDLAEDLSTIRSGYSSGLRNEIKKHKEDIHINNIAAHDFYDFYQRHHMPSSPARLMISASDWNKLVDIAEKRLSLTACYVEDKIIGVMAIVHDSSWSHYLLSAHSADVGHTVSATTCLLHDAIAAAKEMGQQVFNMEGSMMKGIYSFMRKFGGSPVPVFAIESQATLLYRSAQTMKRLLR